MKIGFKKFFIFLLIICVLSISYSNASDIDSERNILIDNYEDLNIESIENENNNLENEEKDFNVQDINIPINTESDDLNQNDDNTNANPETNEDSFSDDESLTEEDEHSIIIKTTPKISIKSSYLKSRDTLHVYLKNSDNTCLKNKKINLLINNKKFIAFTNEQGMASINLFLIPKTYYINIDFSGDEYYNPISKKFSINIKKLGTNIKTYANYVVHHKRLYIYLIGKDWKGIPNRKVIIKFRKKTYKKTTNKKGYVSLKINLPAGQKYLIRVQFKGDKYFYKSYKKFKFHVTKSLKFSIGNRILLTNGYLRIYLKNKNKKAISYKKMSIKIGKKIFSKRTNSEGIIVLKPNLKSGNYTVVVKYGKYSVNKRIKCIEEYAKDPLKNSIPLANGAPNLDYMLGNYVMGDDSATYTLKKSQYKEVIIRDSYFLFLNNKLSRYVFCKTKEHPKLNHVVKREKWNVIEREINKKIVKANKINYWPGSVKVSLKGKSYKYPEVRDVQNTGYTCGPSSASVCSQVLRNYICEKQFAKLAKTNRSGTTVHNLEKALKQNNFTCIYFYKDSFDIGLSELKKGGCALIFHAQHHYISILDISPDKKKVLVSNSYGSYGGIPTKWISVSYMKSKFGVWDDSLVIKLNYTLSDSTKNRVNCFYNSMGANWHRTGTKSKIGSI